MRVSDVRKKYPEFFATVEAAVYDDINEACKKTCLPPTKTVNSIAYNAAAVATLELHKIASRKKIVVTGKTSTNKQSTPCSADYHKACRIAGCAICPRCDKKL
jgi:hypothetical protein